MDGLFAGLDVSTQSCKLVVIDLSDPGAVYVDRVWYDEDLPAYGTVRGALPAADPRVSESDPRMWIDAVDLLLSRSRGSSVDLGAIRAISVSGQQHAFVCLDAQGALASNCVKLWNDTSASDQARELGDRMGDEQALIRLIGNTLRPSYCAPKILQLRQRHPDVYRRTATLLMVHCFINWHLTGGIDGGVACWESAEAATSGLWDTRTRQWAEPMISAIDPGLRNKLPPVRSARGSVGTIAPRRCDAYGLSLQCRVDAGSGDNMLAALGTGNFEPGTVTISLGTSGTACTVTEQPFVDPSGEVAGLCDSTGRYLALSCVLNMANGYSEARATFGLSHAQFEEVVDATEPGNGGRILVPWFQGERTPDLPDASPVYFGFQAADFEPPIVCRAILEGEILNLERSSRHLPARPEALRLTGGLSRSRTWCQAVADIFETTVVPIRGEGAALGAALHAAWVWHAEHNRALPLRQIVERFVAPGARIRPRPEHAAAHRLQKRLFEAVCNRAQGLPGEDPLALRRALLDRPASLDVPPPEPYGDWERRYSSLKTKS